MLVSVSVLKILIKPFLFQDKTAANEPDAMKSPGSFLFK